MPSIKEMLMDLLQHDNSPLFMVFGELESLVDYLLTNGVTVRKWISVAERMPDLNDDKWEDEDGSTCSFEVTDWVWGITAEKMQVRVRYETGPVFQGWYEEDGKTWVITHWMPLPPEPEVEDGH